MKKIKKKQLTNKEKMFVKEYLIDLNATQAAIRAGYSQKTARNIASQNLAKLHIQEALEKEFAARAERVEVTQDYVIKGFVEVAERCLQRKPVLVYNPVKKRYEQEIDEEGRAVWQFDSAGANKAFTKLGENLGMFKKVYASDPDNPLFPSVVITRSDKQSKKR